jgi:hypothetical protein
MESSRELDKVKLLTRRAFVKVRVNMTVHNNLIKFYVE